MKQVIEVEITNIHVGATYYSFNYKVTLNGNVFKEETYHGDHVWGEAKINHFSKILNDGFALDLVIGAIGSFYK